MVNLSEADEQIDKLKKNVSRVEEIANAIAIFVKLGSYG